MPIYVSRYLIKAAALPHICSNRLHTTVLWTRLMSRSFISRWHITYKPSAVICCVVGTISVCPNKNFRCRFKYEKHWIGTFSHMKFRFHIWNGNVFTYEVPNSNMKLTGSTFHGNMHFICEIERTRMKINFTYEIFILHMKLKQFAYEIFVKVVRWFIITISIRNEWPPKTIKIPSRTKNKTY